LSEQENLRNWIGSEKYWKASVRLASQTSSKESSVPRKPKSEINHSTTRTSIVYSVSVDDIVKELDMDMPTGMELIKVSINHPSFVMAEDINRKPRDMEVFVTFTFEKYEVFK